MAPRWVLTTASGSSSARPTSAADSSADSQRGDASGTCSGPPGGLADVAKALASTRYGLTLGVHSRLESFADEVRALVPAGNCYVNRSIIGAVVGVQPFGGEGLSGTGPKAGGPYALTRFAVERVVSVNTAAQGGDPALFNL